MTRGLILIAGVLAAGCSNDPPPIREATPVSGEKAVLAEFHPPAKPAKSDPDAAKLVAAALAAHNCTDAATLAKLKAASLHRTGLTTTPDGLRAPLTCDIDVFVPGRYRAAITVSRPEKAENFVLVVNPDAGSIAIPGGPASPLNEPTLLDLHSQMAEEEFLLMFPLADPTTVAVPAPEVAVNESPAAGAYVWSPALAPALVHFDKKTGRVARVVYRGRENNGEVLKEIRVREHREFGGVWLPTKFELRTNGRLFLDVEKQTFEIGKTFDPARFKP